MTSAAARAGTKKPTRPCTPAERALAEDNMALAARMAWDYWRNHRWLCYEELKSEACLILVTCAQRWDPSRGRFSTLAYVAITRHFWLHCQRARRSRPLWSGPRLDLSPDADDLIQSEASRFLGDHPAPPGPDHQEELARLRAARARLGPRERLALALRYEEGRSLSGVGEAMGVSRCRAGQLVNKARERLRQDLGLRGD